MAVVFAVRPAYAARRVWQIRAMLFSFYVSVKRNLHRLAGVERRLRQRLGRPRRRQVDRLPRPIPKRIWIYWDRGEAAAPALVQRCIRSWREANPGWEVVVLDARSCGAEVDMPPLPASIAPAHFADVLRLRLLARHGGVWADATLFCARPLDDWLPMLAGQSGFFVFSWIAGDRAFLGPSASRTIGNWFLASEPGGALITAWDRLTLAYWRGRRRAGSYFWQNDGFEWLLWSDRAARGVWARTPRMGALAPHLAWHALDTGQDDPAIRAALAGGTIPVHKLSWRMQRTVAEVEALIAPAPAADG